MVIGPDEKRVVVPAVRADLMFDPAARQAPGGDLVNYFTQRVKNDPGSLSSSLVLSANIDDGPYSRPTRDPEDTSCRHLGRPWASFQ